MNVDYTNSSVLVSANGRLSQSIPVCLLQAGHGVTLLTNNTDQALRGIKEHVRDLCCTESNAFHWDQLKLKTEPNLALCYRLGIAITGEDMEEKKEAIRQLESQLLPDALLAINTESIPLRVLQEACQYPERLVGVNWVEPAHTTFFLEIITNDFTSKTLVNGLFHLAKTAWNKDPYLVSNEESIRARMFGAMVREAFFLVQNGYASIEDVDRACRNDPGYYLPFSGNFRYMDLMGTYAYGLVMKDLNRELSRENRVPIFFEEIIEQGCLGMESGKGFYDYQDGDVERWQRLFSKFSYQIQEIICKYPFQYREKLSCTDSKTFPA